VLACQLPTANCPCRKDELEELMLLNLSKKTWTDGLLLKDFSAHTSSNEAVVKELQQLAYR
jgi:hypothetical protein